MVKTLDEALEKFKEMLKERDAWKKWRKDNPSNIGGRSRYPIREMLAKQCFDGVAGAQKVLGLSDDDVNKLEKELDIEI